MNAQNLRFVSDSLHSNFLDTFYIQEVEIISPVSKKYQVGSKTQSFTPMQKKNASTGSLTGLISKYAPVYIKSDAGGLASFKFRGTSSSHTSVLVGGLNINSLTLGSSNTNNIPIFLFDNIDLSFGSSSAANGSGSIGGSVRLGFDNLWTNGVKADIIGSAGSFGEYMCGTKIYAGNGNFESITRILHYQKENNFSFLNTADYDFEEKKHKRDTQKYASIKNQHLIQQFNYKFNSKQTIKSFLWINNNWHEAQPNMAENTDESLSPRAIEEQNFKSWIRYDQQFKMFDFYTGAGYVKDKMVDQLDDSQSIGTQRIISEIGINQGKTRLKYQIGIKYKYIIPEVYAYDNDISEEHIDFHSALFLDITPRLRSTLNIRQQYVSRFNAPFTPAFGLDYLMIKAEHSVIRITNNIQRSYRIPTLNDRFWGQPGYSGNKNLLPEDGVNYEIGLNYTYCDNDMTLKINSTYFYMDVDNWIMWVQRTEGWRAENVLRVISQGVEIHTNIDFNIGELSFNTAMNYTYNSAIRKKSSNTTDKLNRQLEYAPKHIGNAFIAADYKNYNFNIDGSYTGIRYYNQTDKYLDAYTIINLSAYKKIKFDHHKLQIGFQINNLFSKQYQNQYRYAMPETNYRVSVKYNFTNKN